MDSFSTKSSRIVKKLRSSEERGHTVKKWTRPKGFGIDVRKKNEAATEKKRSGDEKLKAAGRRVVNTGVCMTHKAGPPRMDTPGIAARLPCKQPEPSKSEKRKSLGSQHRLGRETWAF